MFRELNVAIEFRTAEILGSAPSLDSKFKHFVYEFDIAHTKAECGETPTPHSLFTTKYDGEDLENIWLLTMVSTKSRIGQWAEWR